MKLLSEQNPLYWLSRYGIITPAYKYEELDDKYHQGDRERYVFLSVGYCVAQYFYPIAKFNMLNSRYSRLGISKACSLFKFKKQFFF